MKFRKKPVVVEAVQFNPEAKNWTDFEIPVGVRPTCYAEVSVLLGTSGCSKEKPYWQWNVMGVVETISGPHTVSPGDWILPEASGGVYPCRKDVFEVTYERVKGS